MNAFPVWSSTVRVALLRYGRSRGLWIALLIALIGVRFWVPRLDGTTITIAVDQHLPPMTSDVLGTCLGAVVTILLLPLGFIYLRSSTTTREPWQVVDVSAASRLALVAGNFAADTCLLLLLLVALTVAGWVTAWALLKPGDIHFLGITYALWIGCVPALTCLAGLRQLFAAFPWTRRWLGEVFYFVLWMESLAIPLQMSRLRPEWQRYLMDFTGYMQPLAECAHSAVPLQIGFGMPYLPGSVLLDIGPLLHSRAYVLARLCWLCLSVVLVIAATLYVPRKNRGHAVAEVSRKTHDRPADQAAPKFVSFNRWPVIGLVTNQLRLLVRGRASLIASGLVASTGLFADFRHVTSPAILAVQLFSLSSWTAASERMAALTSLTPTSAAVRRLAFLAAGLIWALLLALPAILRKGRWHGLVLEMAVTFAACLLASGLSILTRSPFASRLVLFVAWYGYVSSM